ncbi:hypothetical protein C7974DRAFT_213861 [Boeremia exigua]|uniref:uncharacterized protein n=1 Tax=Boeremia exigua TaxID=749465 RepID=UPI001E8E8801|nr:uncharacterized protein C7974DRAFT_213861 [Boeremia exigua]KAH6621949.1 hypothetical protein C7974DRAFT_213861 [Boeremia exigua]
MFLHTSTLMLPTDSNSAPTSRLVVLGLAATVAPKTTLRRSATSLVTPTLSLAATARSWVTFRVTALSQRTGRRSSARTARSSVTPSSAARLLLLRPIRWVEVVLLKRLVTGELETTPPPRVEVRLPGTLVLEEEVGRWCSSRPHHRPVQLLRHDCRSNNAFHQDGMKIGV